MRIAINTRFLSAGNLEGLGRFAYETSKWMVEHHPEHEYFFIFDRKFDPKYIFSERITPLLIAPPARHPFLWYLWYEWALPRVLRKHKIDLFISTDGLGSLRSKTPSCTVVHDLAFEHFPDQVSFLTRTYYRYFIPRYIRSFARLATVSEASKQDMTDRYDIDPEKISVVYSACPDTFHPLPAAEQQAVRDRYTEGKAYFIFVGAISPRKNTVKIMEAYELFRMRQGTDMKLVLVGRKAWMTGEFDKCLSNHPYRDDIIHLQGVDSSTLTGLLGSAYASLYPSLLEGFGLPVLEAQKSGVPLITSNCFSMPEVAGDGALLVDPESAGDICSKMEALYTDEALRLALIEKGTRNWPRYSWARTAALLYDCAMQAVAQHPLQPAVSGENECG